MKSDVAHPGFGALNPRTRITRGCILQTSNTTVFSRRQQNMDVPAAANALGTLGAVISPLFPYQMLLLIFLA